MNSGIFSLSTSMSSDYTDRLGIITDNLANSATPGYRRTYVSQASFDAILEEARQAEFGQQADSPVFTHDFTQGPLKETGRALDFAINGEGFFVVENNNSGEYYTRNGSFQVASDGQLMNTGGLKVQGESGPVVIPSGTSASTLKVDPDGTLYAGDQTVGKIRMVEFLNTSNLVKVGPTIFDAVQGILPVTAEKSELCNKMLEGSNASVFEEMAELIVCMRSFEACQKMLKADDNVQKKMIQKIQV